MEAPGPSNTLDDLVEQAISIATRHQLDGMTEVRDRQKMGFSIMGRLRRTYAQPLRALARSGTLSANELVAAIIAPKEFPWDVEYVEMAAAVASGARDRARRSRGNPEQSFPETEVSSEMYEELRERLRQGGR